jgi:parallel beta-helix repeat protein
MKRRAVLSLLATSGIYVVTTRAAVDAPRLNTSFPTGDLRRYGVAPSGAPEVNSAALQRCLDESAGKATVRVPAADADYTLAGRITAPAHTTIVLEKGARLRWVSTQQNGGELVRSPTRPGLEVVGDNFSLTGEGHIIGPSTGAFVASEIGLFCSGTTSARRRGFIVGQNVDFMNWGQFGIVAAFTSNIEITGITVHHCGYAGIACLSCADGKILHNEVGAIGPGANGNAYCISCTHDSRYYNQDPNAESNGRAVANPFCSNMLVEGNTAYDNPLWTGIDFHGAWDCTARGNHVYNCRHGVLMQGSSGDGIDYSGSANTVIGNSVTTKRLNGDPTQVTQPTRLGISVNGGHRHRHEHIVVQNNAIDGYGDSAHGSFALQHTNTTGVEISGNKVSNWKGYGCYSAYSDGVIRGNEFGPPADPTGTAVIFVATGGQLEITGNRLLAGAGPRAMYGVYINDPKDQPYRIHDNDFRAASNQQYAGHGGAPLDARMMRP